MATRAHGASCAIYAGEFKKVFNILQFEVKSRRIQCFLKCSKYSLKMIIIFGTAHYTGQLLASVDDRFLFYFPSALGKG